MIGHYKGKNILIKTYLSESGLFYLAKSLGDALSENNNVYYVSKSKYIDTRGFFKRVYPQPSDPTLLDGMRVFNLTEKKPIYNQILEIGIKGIAMLMGGLLILGLVVSPFLNRFKRKRKE